MSYRAVSDASHFDTKTSIVDENNRIVAQVVDEKQATLIAAAPDMLEALKFLIADENTELCGDTYEVITAIIAKAEGR